MKLVLSVCITIAFLILNISCQTTHNEDIEIDSDENYIVGSWIVDSTNRELEPNEHSRIVFIEFTSDNQAFSNFYSYKRNKVYTSNLELSITDSTFKYTDDEAMNSPFSEGYRIEKINSNSFKLIAKFRTGRTIPPMDSIIYYSRINNITSYLEPIIANNISKEKKHTILKLDKLNGFWKLDSIETVSYTEFAKNSFVYLNSNGIWQNIWINGYKNSEDSKPVIIEKNKITFEELYTFNIKALDDYQLILENPRNSIHSRTSYLTRINPDLIIPDSLRIDDK